MPILSPRPRTRQPFPLGDQLRHALTGLGYRLLSKLLARRFRREVELGSLARARILILKPCCLGDVVFSTALVRELRRALPDARIVYATGAHSRPAIAGSSRVDAILDTGPVGSGRYRLGDYLRLVHRLRAERFDVCFVLERSAILALVPLVAGIPVRVGIDSGGRGFSLGVAVPARPARPESELYLDLLRAIGGQPLHGELEFLPSAAAVARVQRLLDERSLRSGHFVVLHCAGGANPGMSLLRKRWPVGFFGELAERIVVTGAAVVLVGGPEDRDVARELLVGRDTLALTHPEHRSSSSTRRGGLSQRERGPEALAHQGGGSDGNSQRERGDIVDLVGELTLDEVAALARRAAAYVGNDSGPTHLAEAAGANVVMLFGPSDPIMYGPRSRRAIAVSAGLWCSPCFENGRVAPCANVLCMRAISVERVWNELRPSLPEGDTSR